MEIGKKFFKIDVLEWPKTVKNWTKHAQTMKKLDKKLKFPIFFHLVNFTSLFDSVHSVTLTTSLVQIMCRVFEI